MKKTSIQIVGANGYSGEELCTLLNRHPGIEILGVTSRQHAGQRVGSVLARLEGRSALAKLTFSFPEISTLLASSAEFFFLALPHGVAADFAVPLLQAGRRVIDLSADFRLRDAACFEEFYGLVHPAPELLKTAVYGMPELYRNSIRSATLVASPGCYPTSILLPLAPLLRAQLLDLQSIQVATASGVTGAGRKADVAYLYAECNENMRAYGIPKHRHLSEIEQELSILAHTPVHLTFVPHLIPINRGIHSTLFVRMNSGCSFDDVLPTLKAAYESEPFVRVRKTLPEIRHVVGSNMCDLTARYDARTQQGILLSVLDNLTKGAAGQAVQSFNLMAGYPETLGLE